MDEKIQYKDRLNKYILEEAEYPGRFSHGTVASIRNIKSIRKKYVKKLCHNNTALS